MVLRTLGIIVCINLGVLFTGAVTAQTRVGDWEFRVESDDTETERRFALTSAHPYSGGESIPSLVIRRKKPDSPVELLITATHDKAVDKCDYKNWKILIDATSVPVLGHTFEPARTVLKSKWKTPEDEFWRLFREGLKLTVQVEQKCASFSGKSKTTSHSFSLRGSNAAYKFVVGGAE